MQEKNFNISVRVKSTADLAFNALSKQLSLWWGKTDRTISSKGDIFKISWGEPWYQFEVIRLEFPFELSWRCIDANQLIKGLENVEKEWVGSTLHWSIKELEDSEIEISFLHKGLNPTVACYEVCSKAWTSYITESLAKFLVNNELDGKS